MKDAHSNPEPTPTIMEKDQSQPKPESLEEQHREGLAAIAAVNGYLKNRYLLCEQLSEISSTYDREKDRRKCLEAQIDIVDRLVIQILHFQNSDYDKRVSK